jgi:hypothetical protein
MTTLEKSRAGLLASEGCKWATLTAGQLNLATENHFASYGLAFGYGHGEEARDRLVCDYQATASSNLAAAIQPFLRSNFQARVHRNLQKAIDQAIANRPWTSADGWAQDIVGMVRTFSWEFSAGTRLFGISGLVGDCDDDDDDTNEEITWMVSGYMDPLGYGPDPEWLFYALAADVLGEPEAIKELTADGIAGKAFNNND